MNQFYVSIIFLGITLMIIALVWIAYDFKRSKDYEKGIEEKKNELLAIMSDSEQMIEELNKFSDYIVTQMDIKNEEMCNSLKMVEEKAKLLSVKATEAADVKILQRDKVVNGTSVETASFAEPNLFTYNSDLVIDSIHMESVSSPGVRAGKSSGVRADKVIPINGRHKEVMRLYDKGMSDTEIARTLNMGKGEIQLILGMNR